MSRCRRFLVVAVLVLTGIPQNGLEAVEFAPSFRPDVVSLDIGMPKLNGHELAPHMRAQAWKKDVVLTLTGSGQQE
jgi:DNA-binding response OmpR family regulator